MNINSILRKSKGFLVSTFYVMRLNDPRPVFFLFMPCVWGVSFATNPFYKQSMITLGLFAIATFLMYIFGSVTNDYFDRNIDLLVPRTKDRLLAQRKYSGLVALLISLCVGLISLKIVTMFNTTTTILGILVGLVAFIYPFTKRFCPVPQLVLGIAANGGALIGYSAMLNSLSLGIIAVYIGGVYWTCVYDTMYAYQDLEYDKRIGIHSIPVLYGSQTKQRIKSFATNAFICFAIGGFLEQNRMSLVYYIIVVLDYLLLLKLIEDTNLENPAECYRGLAFNTGIGVIFAIGCIIGRVFAA